MKDIARLAIITSALAVVSAPALAKTPPDLADLVGARGAGGETQLGQRGYEWVRNAHGSQYWWNAGQQTCISLRVAEGRFQTITGEPAAKCDQKGGKAKAAPASAAGTKVSDIVGSTENGADEKLGQRGFVLVDGQQSGASSFKWYYNGKSRQCVLAEIQANKVISLNPSENANCR